MVDCIPQPPSCVATQLLANERQGNNWTDGGGKLLKLPGLIKKAFYII
jgi:hypothetical protein